MTVEPTGDVSARKRLFRGYGPLVGFGLGLVAVSLLVPTLPEKTTIEPASVMGAALDGEGGDGSSTTTTTVAADGSATTAATLDAESAGGTTAGTAAAAGGTGSGVDGTTEQSVNDGVGAAGSGPPTVTGCGDAQVPGDPYSPPCYRFSGDNGGDTSRGVSRNEIVVSVRSQTFNNGAVDALSRIAGTRIPDESQERIDATLRGMTEFINRTYMMYGRKIRLEIYDGKGEVEKEMLGGGQESAQADALKVASEIGAFADMGAVTVPYSDALARQRVLNTGVPYVSREWLSSRRPYVWSAFTDCSTVVEAVSSYYLAKLAKRPAALAGGSLANQPRRVAWIAPENSWYQECVTSGIRLLQQGGASDEIALNEAYQLDINKMAPQASTIVSKLKANNITSVICACDPIILTFLTGKAREQSYSPEWIESGVALTDMDVIGQIMDQQEWDGAFGVSFAGPTLPRQGSPGYRAFKAARPGEEPVLAADLMYYQLQMLAIGIQMAGPNLTPETFEAGMFRYPARTGFLGTWKFGPGDYTTSQDAREIFWSTGAVSPFNRERGAWIDPSGGRNRYPIGSFPAGDPVNR